MADIPRIVRSIPYECRYCKRALCVKMKMIHVPGDEDHAACCQCRVGPLEIDPGAGREMARDAACAFCVEAPFHCTYCDTKCCEYLNWEFWLGPFPTGCVCCFCCGYDDDPQRGPIELEEMCKHCAQRE